MHKVLLAVRIVKNGEVVDYAYRDLTLPFKPFVGLRLEQGISCKLWETVNGPELDPEVERVIYDLDEEQFVCLFTVTAPLAASFWETDKAFRDFQSSVIDRHFRHTPIKR